MSLIRSAVTGVGAYLPETVVSNDDLARLLEIMLGHPFEG